MGNVIIAPQPHWQFLDTTGKPLSNGFIFTYDAGTFNLRNTYTDSSGLVQNSNPIPLDATGSPSNGSVQTGIWLANQSYKFMAYNSAMVLQWSSDNISGYFGLLNQANVWTFGQTFNAAITDTLIDNQIITGAPGNQTTLDYPPPTGNVTLHFPNTADTMVGRDTTDTLTNKTLTSPILNTPTLNSPTITGAATGVPLVSYKNTTPITHTGTVTLDTIYTIPIPVLGLTSLVRVQIFVTCNSTSDNLAHLTVDFGGSVIGSTLSGALGFGSATHIDFVFWNRNNLSAQAWDGKYQDYTPPPTSWGIQFQPLFIGGATASTINTAVPQNLLIQWQNNNVTDSQTFTGVFVEIL